MGTKTLLLSSPLPNPNPKPLFPASKLVSIGRGVVVIQALSGCQLQTKDTMDPFEVLKIFVDKREPTKAVRYASLHPHSQVLFCSIIHEFGKKKDLMSALKAYEVVKKTSNGFSMFACRTIIDVCGLCGDPLRSREIFEDLLSRKITPNTYVFNSLMNVNAHDLSYALYAYKHMQNLGVKADVASFNTLLKACCIAKRVDLAQNIYKELKLLESTSSFGLDVITYTTMIKVFADAKKPQMALQIKEDMLLSGVHPNIVTWSSLIDACAKSGMVDQAVQVFDEMLLVGVEPNEHCCNNLLHACVESCQYDRAFRYFHSWKSAGFRILCASSSERHGDGKSNENASGEFLAWLTKSSHNQNLCSAKVVQFKPTVATYNILMKACGNNYHRAKQLMGEMRIVGLSPDHITWSTLIDICGRTKNLKGAIQAFKTMKSTGVIPDVIAYTSAIKACIESKNVTMAFSLFEEMKRCQLQPSMAAYTTLLRARRRYGSLYEVQQCLSIYQDMRKAGYSSNDHFLKELVEEWCEGVISSGCKNQSSLPLGHSYDKIGLSNTPSLLLEKVAFHLQKDALGDKAIDVRGLTKVEARIIVLSVLRLIKENHSLGYPVKNDMVIITGPGREDPVSSSKEFEVQETIIKILRGELGLEVLVGPGSVPNPSTRRNSYIDDPPMLVNSLVKTQNSLFRRPETLGILKITCAMLRSWLRKRSSAE